MNNADKQYLALADYVLANGRIKKNRTGIDTIGVFGQQIRFNLSEGFPLLTTKKVFFKGVIHELLWFLSGSTNIKYLVDNDVHIWDEWAYTHYIKYYNKEKKRNSNGLWMISKITEKANDSLQGFTGKFEYRQYFQNEFIEKIKTDKEFAEKWGELGEGTYGGMWRAFPFYTDCDEIKKSKFIKGDEAESWFFGEIDQIKKIIDTLNTDPDSRRLVVSAWHPYWVDHCALPPCHCLFQFHTEELTEGERLNLWQKKFPCKDKDRVTIIPSYLPNFEGKDFDKRFDADGIPKYRLNCQLYQRSCDLFLGVPFNIASYALLTHLMAHVSNMVVGDFIHTYGDLHIYTNHLDQIKTQRIREPYPLPQLWLNPDKKNLFDFKFDDIKVLNYQCHPAIKGEVAV